MPNKRKPDRDDAWSRASEVNEAMLGIQPYADDSMFFTIRYADKAKVNDSLTGFDFSPRRQRLTPST